MKWRKLNFKKQIEFIEYQKFLIIHPERSMKKYKYDKQIYLFIGDEYYSGAHAVFYLYYLSDRKLLMTLYNYLPGFSFVSNLSYKIVAANRSFFSKFF